MVLRFLLVRFVWKLELGCYGIMGVDADLSFSQVLVSTRNKSLDRVCTGTNLGGDPITKELKDTQLRFGMLLTRESPHPCFGLDNEITQLRNRGGGLIRRVETDAF